MSGYCNLCDEPIEPGGPLDILDHLRVIHPDVYGGDGVETWPDGGLVITLGEEFDLTVDDFTSTPGIVLDEEQE